VQKFENQKSILDALRRSVVDGRFYDVLDPVASTFE
jgi:hypothetical protein